MNQRESVRQRSRLSPSVNRMTWRYADATDQSTNTHVGHDGHRSRSLCIALTTATATAAKNPVTVLPPNGVYTCPWIATHPAAASLAIAAETRSESTSSKLRAAPRASIDVSMFNALVVARGASRRREHADSRPGPFGQGEG